MTILLLLAPISVLLGLMAVGAFVWTLRAGQYDDIRGAAERILLDDDAPIPDRRDAEQGQTLRRPGRVEDARRIDLASPARTPGRGDELALD